MKSSATTADTNKQIRSNYTTRIKAIQFDIDCLAWGINGETRNAKSIKALERAIEDYKRRLEAIPDNDEPYMRPIQS